ncbi:MAG: 6-hydroxymethylpterin diphosphokinase MptE-like protein [Nitrososphaerota archaeon]
MRLSEPPAGWVEWYGRILADFGFPRERDEEAAEILSDYMSDKRCLVSELASKIGGARCVVVAGAYDTLAEEAVILSEYLSPRIVVVSADTATTPLLDGGITPDIVVTDLDGDFEDIEECWRRGAVIVVHAHGDNMERLRAYVPRLGERVEATCQCLPRGHIHNFGGFTDGDRAVFMAAALGAKRVVTVGMCFTCSVGRYSLATKKPTPDWVRKKRMKLHYAWELLSWLASERSGLELIDATLTPEPPPKGFKKMPLRDIIQESV